VFFFLPHAWLIYKPVLWLHEIKVFRFVCLINNGLNNTNAKKFNIIKFIFYMWATSAVHWLIHCRAQTYSCIMGGLQFQTICLHIVVTELWLNEGLNTSFICQYIYNLVCIVTFDLWDVQSYKPALYNLSCRLSVIVYTSCDNMLYSCLVH